MQKVPATVEMVEIAFTTDKERPMDCITKIYDAITACQEKDKQPKCILCRDEFYNDLLAECEHLSFGNVRVGVQTLGGANTIFGIRLARTPDIDNDVKLFEVIV